MNKTNEEMKPEGTVICSNQCEPPVPDAATESHADGATESQEPSGQPDSSADNKSNPDSQSGAKHAMKEVFQLLFGLSALVALCYCIWLGAKNVYNYYHVESCMHLTDNLDLVKYANDDYQLRWADKHRQFSQRFDKYPNFWNDKQVVHYFHKDGMEKTVSLNTFKTVTSNHIVRPDRRGVAACIDGDNRLYFMNLHTGELAFSARFPLFSIYDNEDEDIQFNGAYCVFTTREGKCLIDTNGNVLLHGLEQIEVVDDCYITTMTGIEDDWRESLYDAHDMRCLLADKDVIELTPVGIYYKEGDQRYLMDSSLTHVITDLVLDDYSDDYDMVYDTFEFYYEPDDPNRNSGFKRFSKNDLCGVFDRNYNVVVEPKYDNIKYLGNGYFACQTGTIAIIIDQKGAPLQYNSISCLTGIARF